jgi:putative membrane protein
MAVTGESVFDEGLQLERTALSWQRTLLSLAVASLAVGRGLDLVIGPTSWLIAAAGVGVTVAMFVVTRRKYLLAHRHLTTVDATSLPHGGRLIIGAAAVSTVAGLSALAFVIHHLS